MSELIPPEFSSVRDAQIKVETTLIMGRAANARVAKFREAGDDVGDHDTRIIAFEKLWSAVIGSQLKIYGPHPDEGPVIEPKPAPRS
jgi:hypothetical protein